MPEISDEELAKYKANEESVKKLEEKNKELLAEKQREKEAKEAAEKKAREEEERRLKDAGLYKELAEKYETDKKLREEEEKKTKEKLEKGAKLSKVQEELTKLGIAPEAVSHALKLVDLGEVKYDEGTGVVLGADIVATKLKVSLPQLFVKKDQEQMKNDPPGSGAPAEMTPEWWAGLSEADRKKHYKAYMKSRGVDVR